KWDTTRTSNGRHKLDIQMFSSDEYVGMASCSVTVSNRSRDLAPPRVAVTSPREGAVVSGITPIIIEASDGTGREPLVSVYVDKSLRCVRNRGPYAYDWDTTAYPNGPHIIEASAEDDASNISPVKPIRVTVRNLGTQTPMMIKAPSDESAAPKIASETSVGIPTATASGATPTGSGVKTSSESKEVARADQLRPESFEVAQKPLAKAKQLPPPAKVAPPAPTPSPAAQEPPAEPPKLVETPARKPAAPVLVAKAESDIETPKCPPSATRADSAEVYVVRPGDSLGRLARKFGVSVKTLVALNDIEDPSLIKIGQKLRVPVCSAQMIAIRGVFEEAGGTLTWTGGKRRSVHAVCPQNDVVLKIGSAQALVNDKQVKMDGPAVVNSGRTLVPETFVTGPLGMTVPGK
ncbi:MAG: LysM peptidoglycan-binding domain-containing protein, partial [Armatimonadetes bacterium]|nr:LysM peptidoglycan-binding domain-containing protein [Armatimonadota bacterium]